MPKTKYITVARALVGPSAAMAAKPDGSVIWNETAAAQDNSAAGTTGIHPATRPRPLAGRRELAPRYNASEGTLDAKTRAAHGAGRQAGSA